MYIDNCFEALSLTIIIEFSPEVTATDNLPIELLHSFQPGARVLETHSGSPEEGLRLGMTVKLDAVHRGYLIADLLEEGAFDTLVQTNHKDVPPRGISLPELVVLHKEVQHRGK